MKLWVSLALFGTLFTSVLAKPHHLPSFPDQCGRHPAQSCSAAANQTANSCCVEKKAGLFLLSQFWDVHAGYEDSWTIHGLWNDFCNGSYPSNCDPSRSYTNITEVLVSRRAFKLLQDMNNDWPNSAGHVDDFWSHEWNKHGTCMSTFEPGCYEKKDPFQGMIDYFNTTMKLHKKYNIYKALKRHGIVPGHKYSTSKVQKVIKKEFGMLPDLRCTTEGHLVETWMYFHVNGPVKRMDIVPTLNNNATNCNSTLIYPTKYPNDTANPKIW
ncbi:ribonuclease T2-like protein [Halteromyces radiatus]|uniref:ribonuclease T2-like protein n=1 Tax=Halteromyces radiatus TaxID=101107 RepID=UPI00221FDF75|nr:ribonuclease T2-like protein [Halteromyces radiatus]KAI8079729.1 ribonuclease T2-like protein [Halteromyces radiatus]